MANHTGSLVFTPNLGLIGIPQLIMGTVTFAEALDTAETITISVDTNGIPVFVHDFSVEGTNMDAHATVKTLGVKWGTSGDDDGFQVATVYNALGTIMPAISAPGALIGTKVNLTSIIGTVTADPATDVTSGTWTVKMWATPCSIA